MCNRDTHFYASFHILDYMSLGEAHTLNTIRIVGGHPLQGEITVQGSKNAALPILAATLLNPGKTELFNCPFISDVEDMLAILASLGCKIHRNHRTLTIDSSQLTSHCVPMHHAGRMRSSVLCLGALLGRLGEAAIPYPGGCVIGQRPIDLHLKGLQELGVVIREEENGIYGSGRPKGGHTTLSIPSVGATENLLLAAAGGNKRTVLCGCAMEPEILALCQYLQSIGVNIQGIGSPQLIIEPAREFRFSRFTIPGDRIVAGTYVLAVAGTGGSVAIKGVDEIGWRGQCYPYGMLGLQIQYDQTKKTLTVIAPEKLRSIHFLDTAPYPGFPTDLQSQMLAVLTCAHGSSCLQETIFEQRFRIVKELRKMGAKVYREGSLVMIEGVPCLRGASLQTKELRGGAALVIAGLMAQGESEIHGVSFIERGYEDICRDLQMLGAQIEFKKGDRR